MARGLCLVMPHRPATPGPGTKLRADRRGKGQAPDPAVKDLMLEVPAVASGAAGGSGATAGGGILTEKGTWSLEGGMNMTKMLEMIWSLNASNCRSKLS